MTIREYLKPTTLIELQQQLNAYPSAVLVAGGTALVPALQNTDASSVIDLSKLPLDFVENRADGLHIGALCTLNNLATANAAKTWGRGLLAQAATLDTAVNVRNAATLGGLAAQAESTSPLFLAMLALDARVEILAKTGTSNSVELQEAQTELRKTASVITKIVLPSTLADACCGISSVGRTPRDEAIVIAIAVVDPTNRSGTLVLGGVSEIPLVFTEIKDYALLTTRLGERLDSVSIINDFRGSDGYRRAMAFVTAQRAWEEAIAVAKNT